jgi:hypothetical protein
MQHSRRKVRLDSIKGIADEQARAFRQYLNGKLKAGEMTKVMFSLREIRQSIEAIPPEPAAHNPPTIHVIAVESGYYVKDVAELNGAIEPANGSKSLQLEHVVDAEISDCAQDIAPTDHAFTPQTERERQLLAELELLSSEELLERAKRAGYVDVDGL